MTSLRRLLLVALPIGAVSAFAISTAPVAESATVKSYRYVGKTNQCPVRNGLCGRAVIKLAGDFSHLTNIEIQYKADCKSGTLVRDRLRADRIFVTSLGKNKGVKWEERGIVKRIDMTKGRTGRATLDFRGALYPTGKGKGSLVANVAVFNTAGVQIDSCSEKVYWKVALQR